MPEPVEDLSIFDVVELRTPFFYVLIPVFTSLFLLSLFLRRNSTFQFFVLGVVVSTLATAQRLNASLSLHWARLGLPHNYFDGNGHFFALFIAFPMVFLGTTALSCLLGIVCTEAAEAKRFKMRMQARREKGD